MRGTAGNSRSYRDYSPGANHYLYGAAVDMLLAEEQSFLPGSGGPGGVDTEGPGGSDGPGGGGSSGGTSDNILWPLADHLGSVRDLIDSGGKRREHRVYDSFGNVTTEIDYDSAEVVISSSSAEAVDSEIGYTGREWDDDVGLQHNRARWYDPAQGRWISQDPIGFAAGDVNLYRYVGNGPVDATDPSGLQEPESAQPKSLPELFPPRPNALPKPAMMTGWLNKNQLWPWQSAWTEGSYYIFFQRDQSVANYTGTGFTKENANTAWQKGCFMLASHRIGLPGRHLAVAPGVMPFTNLDAAWIQLEELVSQGKIVRLVLIQSAGAPIVPPGHDYRKPLPVSDDSPHPLKDMMPRYDYVTLHWDKMQQQYFWESQHDSCNSVDSRGQKLGQHWRSATPMSGLPFTAYLVVVITPEMEKDAQGLPEVPWNEHRQ